MERDTAAPDPQRREVLKKAVFIAPVVLTLAASPAFAQNGSKPGSTLPPLPKDPPPIPIPKI